jgi:hypothetical protein
MTPLWAALTGGAVVPGPAPHCDPAEGALGRIGPAMEACAFDQGE